MLAIGGYVSSLSSKKRTQRLQQLLTPKGFAFHPEVAEVADEKLPPFTFGLFEKGFGSFNRYGRDIEGSVLTRSFDGAEVTLFDYPTTDGESDLKQTTLACFHLKEVNLPDFRLQPRKWLEDFYDVYKTTTHKRFAKAYRLTPEKEAVEAFFDDDKRYFFGRNEGWTVEAGVGEWLIVYRFNQVVKPEELVRFLQAAVEVSRVFAG